MGSDGLLSALRNLRDGDFGYRIAVDSTDVPVELATVFNEIAAHNEELVAELIRLRGAVGRDGRLGERIRNDQRTGGYGDAADAVNGLIEDLTRPTVELNRVLGAVAKGDLSQRMALLLDDRPLQGRFAELGRTVNGLLEQLSLFATEVTRVAREIGTDGRLGGQAEVPGVAGTWKDLTDNVNVMAENLTGQVRNIAEVTTAVALGDLTRKITVEVSGEMLALKNTINTMVDQLSAFADEVTRVAREVGSDGRLGGQAKVPGVAGTWRDLTDSVNFMANNLTTQVRNIAAVATAVASGDLSQKISVDVKGEILELKNTLNTMVDQLSAFADEVTRVAREVGTEGKLGGQARVRGVAGTWKDLTDNVNVMAENLTGQVRSIAAVAGAVAGGDLSKKITVEAKGEVAALADTFNGMVDTLRAFADEVTRVAREVGTEGILGGQAHVRNVAGIWKDLTDNVNSMAFNLTSQVRNIAQVTTAVASGDLSKKIDVDARGEILELKNTLNTMVDQLSAFADEVTRVAREVGTEGKLGGQAQVRGVAGTWQDLTESVNQLAGNLTTQVRAIAAVATAVTAGDLTRQITVDASGEVAELKDNINRMIGNLKETTRTNQEQDWLKTNLARISGLMQGHRDFGTVSMLILSELAPLVNAQHGAFFLSRTDPDQVTTLEQTAAYGRVNAIPPRFGLGESLVGQAAMDKKTILVADAPPDYVKVASGLGSTRRIQVIVLPLMFEGQALGVIELSTVNRFTAVHQDLLEQLKEPIGIGVNTILANERTEALLGESQRLAQELRAQQQELQRSNTELAEKAALLARQNSDIEVKNFEIEQARQELEERAQQLAIASKYKSEFMANMSHELRTPLNSALVLAKVLAENHDDNLTGKQVEYARTIHSAGSDLLQLINDILDLAKVEAGHLEPHPTEVSVPLLVDYVESMCRPLTTDKGLDFEVVVDPDTRPVLHTDEQRLQQILRNLLSNAVKFTHSGTVRLRIRMAGPNEVRTPALRAEPAVFAFAVIDTGVGIPEDKLGVIFEAFRQADGTTNRAYGGTGLGLSISRDLTQLLGGELTVRSEPGVGSTFTLYLPATVPAASMTPVLSNGEVPVPALTAAPDPDHAFDLRFRGVKVLIVDDDPRNVFALTAVLEQRGFDVVSADTGVSGIRVLEQNPEIALVLMDVMMPELDGNATIAAIRNMRQHADLPIIAVTAKAMPEDRQRTLAAGANDYVTKPVDAHQLLELMAAHLEEDIALPVTASPPLRN
ncbi:MAG TPA: HAMP domain-containing protein [Actinophytocola sp.]|uniref:HAMP domain-containing protein n=1 Tax=Actinophytocola sp. TaxID=1872138 RepID=UPI002DB66078|nr:HAMP domain-containing protein [Actinophytocola sp.]HEU5472431.1 HAMP domain-containing protein [Actinophytocola sp.]